ncbi:hypothetical protein [Alkanindiges illinoisensis]|uniref:Uncharacterized protein n=1 Tax=Alkanindiges illinoisensis TaxID=197183 RepID=A0A4Y7XAA2_9GAMM|nr:hypothetical protein [Alkanindiges illinoisensis]TEU24918.1 hypothetical protein E2B99_11035 [Alkanindiges illinoisensis]
MKPILLPDLNLTELHTAKPNSPESAGYSSYSAKPIKQTIKPAVHVGLIINHSPDAGINVERIEVHVILISD